MQHQRSVIGGGTDYTGVSIEDIFNDLKEWENTTEYTIKKLKTLREECIVNKNRIDHLEDIVGFIDFSINKFSRALTDFNRLLSEIPKGVNQSHIETIEQIYNMSEWHDKICVNFKRDYIETELKDESLRHLIDSIYAETREEIIDYADLSNVKKRLKALIGISMIDKKSGFSIDDLEAIELKPNFFGIGLNLNYIIKRIKCFFRKNRYSSQKADD